MPFRRRVIVRRPRPRTRWVAISPGSIQNMGDDTFNFATLNIDGAATGLAPYTGGTILRTLLQVQLIPSLALTYPSAGASGWQYNYHFGVFATPDTSPEVGQWDPNTPRGDFMTRFTLSKDATYYVDSAAGSFAISDVNSNMLVDIPVKRSIREGTRLFMTAVGFLGGTMISDASVGWTGRVLIRLP